MKSREHRESNRGSGRGAAGTRTVRSGQDRRSVPVDDEAAGGTPLDTDPEQRDFVSPEGLQSRTRPN